jgi:hypothetical protein
MRKTERNCLLLLAIVVDGLDKWLQTAGTVWRGLLIDTEIRTNIFRDFVVQAGVNPAQQLVILLGQQARQQRAWDQRESTRRAIQQAQRAAILDLREYARRA